MEIEISGYTVLIDDEDYEKISKYKWVPAGRHQDKEAYFHSPMKYPNGKWRGISLHRLIMGCTLNDGLVVDHIDHNILDNRKSNLRIGNDHDNKHNTQKPVTNTSGYKGVYQIPSGKYVANIAVNSVRRYIGRSNDPVECAKMYDMIAIKLFGEFACTNFPKENYLEKDIDELYKTISNNGKHMPNKTGYTGVSYDKARKRWKAAIKKNGKMVSLHRHKTPEDAAREYDREAYKLHGDNAKLNFPEEYM